MSKVFVVSRVLLNRLSLMALLRDNGGDLVVEGGDKGDLASPSFAANPPDLVLLFEEKIDAATLQEVKDKAGAVKCAVVAGSFGHAEHLRAIVLGYEGMLLSSQAPEVLVQSIRVVLAGNKVFLHSPLTMMNGGGQTAEEGARTGSLRPRELQIIRGISLGLSNRELADYLGIAPGLVRASVFRLFVKIGVQSRIQLIKWAREKGLAKDLVAT